MRPGDWKGAQTGRLESPPYKGTGQDSSGLVGLCRAFEFKRCWRTSASGRRNSEFGKRKRGWGRAARAGLADIALPSRELIPNDLRFFQTIPMDSNPFKKNIFKPQMSTDQTQMRDAPGVRLVKRHKCRAPAAGAAPWRNRSAGVKTSARQSVFVNPPASAFVKLRRKASSVQAQGWQISRGVWMRGLQATRCGWSCGHSRRPLISVAGQFQPIETRFN